MPQQYFAEIQQLLARVPRDLLLLLKTNDCLRHIDRALGAPVNTFLVAARIAVDVLEQEELNNSSAHTVGGRVHWGAALRMRVRHALRRLHLRLRLLALRVLALRAERAVAAAQRAQLRRQLALAQ
ncbi:hypothetical protein JKP88DRAFT_255919 [Tribonema minus]|uniref:Uncharacterized protein n=1 Tax=Tribonema minus TaxID=303371 RepID=A0A835YW53_9STRA|nr:hypothetical protein JKP88DRAFT_255919 [Tribonema minus]